MIYHLYGFTKPLNHLYSDHPNWKKNQIFTDKSNYLFL